MKKDIAAFSLLFAVIFFWGVTWPVMKTALLYTPPLWFGVFRMLTGAFGMFFLLFLLGKAEFPDRSDFSVMISIGVLQMAVPTALMHFSLLYVDAGRASLLAFTHPLWIAPLAVFILKEPFTRFTGAGLLSGMAGIMVLFNPFYFDWTDPKVIAGNGMLILSAISWAVGIFHVRLHRWKRSALALSPWSMLLSSLLLAILALVREDITLVTPTADFFYIILFTGLIATAFCYWGAVYVAQKLPAMVTSLGFLGVPVVGILSSGIFLSENMTFSLFTGLFLILSGITSLIFGEVKSHKDRFRENS